MLPLFVKEVFTVFKKVLFEPEFRPVVIDSQILRESAKWKGMQLLERMNLDISNAGFTAL